MERRSFLKSATLGGAGALAVGSPAPTHAYAAEKPLGTKITRVRFYRNPRSPAHFNQSFHIVTVETDQGVTGIGEGGSPRIVWVTAARGAVGSGFGIEARSATV